MTADRSALDELYATVASRKGADPNTSYTARLLSKGPGACAQKLGEEAVETIIAALQDDRDSLIHESADLICHLLGLWALIINGAVLLALDIWQSR